MTQAVDPLLAADLPAEAPKETSFVESGVGQGITGLLGAARSASFGATDVIAKNLAELVGGKESGKDVARTLREYKEANPYADLAGELGGMVVGGGGGLTAVGTEAEAKIAASLGEGLLGKVAAGAGRGAAEGAYLGLQHSITEDAIGDGDHAKNGEAYFASVPKEALLGGAIGAATGAAGYGLGRLFGRGAEKATEAAEKGVDVATDERAAKGLALGPYRKPGPLGTDAVDELVGAKGAAGLAKESARASEDAVEALRKTGRFTSEQAAELVDGANRVADAAATAKGAAKEDVGDAIASWYAKTVGGKDPDAVAALQRHYSIQRGLRDSSEDFIRSSAAKTAKQLTDVFRNVEDVANESDFVMKASRMKRLMQDVDVDVARDRASEAFEKIHATLDQFASSPEAPLANKLRKQVVEAAKKTFAEEGDDAAHFFMGIDGLNRAVGREVPHSLDKFRMTPLQRALSDTYAEFRDVLRDEGTWGAGGRAQAMANDAFSGMKSRRDDMARTLAQTIDRGDRGVRLAGGDFEKVESMFRKLTGHDTDAELEGIKSVEAFIDGSRQRIGVVREFGDLTAEQAAKLEAGEKALNAFEQSFKAAREEVSANNRVRSMQLVEREGSNIGGLVGLISDTVTKPLTTLDRMASVANTVKRLDEKVTNVVKRVFDGGEQAAKTAARAAHTAQNTAKEIQHIAELAGNPERMSSVVESMFSGLSKTAPKIALEAKATAMRAVTFLANEAPVALGSRVVFGNAQKKPRYSDAQLAAWQAKRDAALGSIDGKTAPEVIVGDLQRGRLSRDAIRTIEFVSPKLFAQMQQTAQEQITKMAAEGKLDKLTLAQQASIASLLKVPPGEIWKPDFMLLMQSAKSYSQFAEQNKSSGGVPAQTSKRAIKMNTDVFETDAQAIEAR